MHVLFNLQILWVCESRHQLTKHNTQTIIGKHGWLTILVTSHQLYEGSTHEFKMHKQSKLKKNYWTEILDQRLPRSLYARLISEWIFFLQKNNFSLIHSTLRPDSLIPICCWYWTYKNVFVFWFVVIFLSFLGYKISLVKDLISKRNWFE